MKKCPKLVHTRKGRERALAYTNELIELESDATHVYKLYHEYDAEPSDVYIRTTIKPAVFELLLANVLFETSEINEEYGIGQEQIAKPILSELYGVEVLEQYSEYDEEFDLYYVWEKWCDLYLNVRELEVLKKEGLVEALSKIVPVSV